MGGAADASAADASAADGPADGPTDLRPVADGQIRRPDSGGELTGHPSAASVLVGASIEQVPSGIPIGVVAGGAADSPSVQPGTRAAGDATQTSFRQYVLGVVLLQITVIGTAAAILSRNTAWVKSIMAMGALSAPFAAIGLLRPVIRRLAVRNAVRRPGQVALVLLGVMFGAALVSSAFVVGDSVREAGRREVLQRLGPVDVVVETGDRAVADRIATLLASNANSAVAARLRDLTDALPLQLTVAELPVVAGPAPSSGADVVARAGVARVNIVRVDFAAASGFGGDARVTGIEGADPVDGRAVLTRPLAKTLGVRIGDTVRLVAPGGPMPVIVDRVVDARGIAGITTAVPPDTSRNLFVSAATFDRLVGGANADGTVRVPIRYLLALSAKGGVGDSGTLSTSASVAASMQRLLEDGGVRGAPISGGALAVDSLPALVTPLKTAALAQAGRAGATFARLFGGVGAFGVLAGLLLLVNVILLFADGRRIELGTLRALGMRRMHVVATYAAEGWAYALAGAILGSAFGVGLGWILLRGAGSVLREAQGAADTRLFVRANGILPGIAVSFAMALATVVLTAIWVSNVSIAAALRGSSASERPRSRRGFLTSLCCLGAVAGALFIGTDGALHVVLAVAAFGMTGVLMNRHFRFGRTGELAVGGAVLLACLISPGLASRSFAESGIGTYVMLGIVAAIAAVFCVVSAQQQVVAMLRKILDRLPARARNRSAATRLGFSYLLSHRLRTGLIIATYTLVVLTLSFVSVVSRSLGDHVGQLTDDARGGYDVVVRTRGSNPITQPELVALPGVVRAVNLPGGTAEFALSGSTDRFRPFGVTAITVDYVAGGAPALGAMETSFATSATAYGAVASRNGLAIVNANLFAEEGPGRSSLAPGDPLYVRDVASGRSLTLHVAAIRRTGLDDVSPVLVGEATFRSLFGTVRSGDTSMLRVADGTDPVAVAKALNARQDRGVEAVAYVELVRDSLRPQIDFLSLLRGYLALGLVLGVVGLAVVTARSVRDRRHDIGVLRALGLDAPMVRHMFMVEAGTVALEGTLLGAVLGVALAWRLSVAGLLGASVALSLPLPALVLLVVVTCVVSVFAVRRPSAAAARLTTADALRAV